MVAGAAIGGSTPGQYQQAGPVPVEEKLKRLLPIMTLALCAALARAEVHVGTALAVIDGGTLVVSDTVIAHREVRLCVVDTPAPDQSAGGAAKDYLVSLLAGREVRVEGAALDAYGRTVGKVWVRPPDCPACGMTLDVNLAMVTAGMARWRRSDAPLQSVEDRGRYESAELEARARGWGLWQQKVDMPPS